MPTDRGGCPDDASCHFNCVTGCWRVANDTPLPSSGRTEWPPSVVAEYGTVEVSPLPLAAPEPAESTPEHSPDPPDSPQGDGSGEASPPAEPAKRRRRQAHVAPPDLEPTPEPAPAREPGAPIVNLTELIQNLHHTRGDLRARAQTLRASARQLEQVYTILLGVAHHCELAADQVEELRTVLNGSQ